MKNLLAIFAMLISVQGFGTQKFVDVANGNNSYGGTFNFPYKTIQYGINQAIAGDSIYVKAGIYYEKIISTVSGTVLQKITLLNYAGGTVIVSGFGSVGGSILSINNGSNLIIEGIVFENNYLHEAIGIYIVGQGTNITVNKCIVRKVGWGTNPNADPYSFSPTRQAHGILVDGRTIMGYKNITISNNSIYDIITGNSEAVTVVGNVDSFYIVNDSVYNTKNIGIVAAGNYDWAIETGVQELLNKARNGIIKNCHVFNNRRFNNVDAPAGIYVDGGDDIAILNNVSYENGNGISVGCEDSFHHSKNIIVANNIIYRNDNKGIVFGSNNGTSLIKNCMVLNNTVFRNTTLNPYDIEIGIQHSDSCTIAQNIVIPKSDSINGIGIYGYITTHLKVDNNIIYRYTGNSYGLYSQTPSNQFVETNAQNFDPLFITPNISPPDLRLAKASSAINAGFITYTMPYDKDAADSFRLVNGKVDIGAYESQDGGCPTEFEINNASTVTGKFIAKNKIIYTYSLSGNISNALFLYAPIVEIKSPVVVQKSLLYNPLGCN